MRKSLLLGLTAALLLSLAACGGGEEALTMEVGETVSTDIFSFTLDQAQLAIALNNSAGEDYFSPKEYDPQEDLKNPFVASKGHTYVAITYTVSNLDRSSAEFHNSTFSGPFASVTYQGKTYSPALKDGARLLYQSEQVVDMSSGRRKIYEANTWYRGATGNLFLSAGDQETRRAYLDLPVEAESLSDGFQITVRIPTSGEEEEKVTYSIPGA